MPTMNIKDPEVRRMAMKLAAQRNTTATGAVRAALQEALERHVNSREGTAGRLLALGKVSSRMQDPVLSDDELYDDHGLPR